MLADAFEPFRSLGIPNDRVAAPPLGKRKDTAYDINLEVSLADELEKEAK